MRSLESREVPRIKPTWTTSFSMRARESEHRPPQETQSSKDTEYSHRPRQGKWFIQDGDSLIPAPPDTHDEEDARIIFGEALVSVRKAAERALGDQRATIGAVSPPQYFNESSRYAVMRALQGVEPKGRQSYRVMVGSHAMRLAYRLNTCEGFGFSSQKCDIEDDTHYVLVVEFEKRHLQLSLLGGGFDTVETLNRTRYNDLGQDKGGTQGSGEVEAHCRHMQDELRAFMIDNNVGPKQKKQDFLQAVIVSGEASDASFEHLRPRIEELLEDQGKSGILRATVRPAFVLAVGAAYQSMVWEKSPELLIEIFDPNLVDVPRDIHDEL